MKIESCLDSQDKSQPVLTICIPTLLEKDRKESLDKLIAELNRQKKDLDPDLGTIEVLKYPDERENTTGYKRNVLYQEAHGKYICSIDDDDWIHKRYLECMLKAAQKNPDVITFDGVYYENGVFVQEFNIRLHNEYNDSKPILQRIPNHITPIRAEIAKSVRFLDRTWGEDYDFTMRLHNQKLLRTEAHIFEKMYHYYYVTNKK